MTIEVPEWVGPATFYASVATYLLFELYNVSVNSQRHLFDSTTN
jgi:hypothetical protein